MPDWVQDLVKLTFEGKLTHSQALQLSTGLVGMSNIFRYSREAANSPLSVEFVQSLAQLFLKLGASEVAEYGAKRSILKRMIEPYGLRWIASDLYPADEGVLKLDWQEAIKDAEFVFAFWPLTPGGGPLHCIDEWLRRGLHQGRTYVVCGGVGYPHSDGSIRTWQEDPHFLEAFKGQVCYADEILPGFIEPVSWQGEPSWSVVRTLVIR